MSTNSTLVARGPTRKHPPGYTTPRLTMLRLIEDATRWGFVGELDVPVPPAKPGEAQILSRRIYIGPTLDDLKRSTEQ